MNMALPPRIASEFNYQQYEGCLRKTTENAITRLDMRELAEREFQDIICKPTKLTGKFREGSVASARLFGNPGKLNQMR
jgi:hypothetical protein